MTDGILDEALDRLRGTGPDDGDAHAIKFADAAVEAYGVRGDPALLVAADHATVLISS